MRLPNLNALRMFDAAARHGSFARAAQEANVTQSAVAQQVRSLEASLGIPLFRRQPRGLGLTVILTLHDLTLAAEHADAVLILHQGRLLAHGAPRDVLTPDTINRAFDVTARIDTTGPSPRYSFHL